MLASLRVETVYLVRGLPSSRWVLALLEQIPPSSRLASVELAVSFCLSSSLCLCAFERNLELAISNSLLPAMLSWVGESPLDEVLSKFPSSKEVTICIPPRLLAHYGEAHIREKLREALQETFERGIVRVKERSWHDDDAGQDYSSLFTS